VMKCIFLSFLFFVTKATYSCLGEWIEWAMSRGTEHPFLNWHSSSQHHQLDQLTPEIIEWQWTLVSGVVAHSNSVHLLSFHTWRQSTLCSWRRTKLGLLIPGNISVSV
jgi:hypothetical protein